MSEKSMNFTIEKEIKSKIPCVYILECFSSKRMFYIGFSSDMQRRIHEHKNKESKFTKRFKTINFIGATYFYNQSKKKGIKEAKNTEKLFKRYLTTQVRKVIKKSLVNYKSVTIVQIQNKKTFEIVHNNIQINVSETNSLLGGS